MLESITMAEVGSIEKVSGSRIATPLGPPRPGSTPTKMPSTSPIIIKASVFQVSSTVKPCNSRVKASIGFVLEAEGRFKRPFRHDDIERDLEGEKHQEREQEAGEQRFPQRDTPDPPHEAGDQQKARDIKPEPLGAEHKQQSRREHLHDASQLRTRDESIARFAVRDEFAAETVKAGRAENNREVKRKIARLRAVR